MAFLVVQVHVCLVHLPVDQGPAKGAPFNAEFTAVIVNMAQYVVGTAFSDDFRPRKAVIALRALFQ
jgi:hypothetical protein